MSKLKCVELFAGAGGLALGLEKSGFEAIALNEIDAKACATLRLNRPQWNVLEQDIIKLSDENLTELFEVRKGDLDLLSGGYPCQSFSYAGLRRGMDDIRGTMFYYYSIFLDKLQPKMFLAENVRGLVTHDDGKTLQTMLSVFENMGYETTYKILNANNYGVAQKRERIVIIGVRKDLSGSIHFEYPKPLDYKPVLRDILMNVPPSDGEQYKESKKAIMDLVPPGGCWRDLPPEMAKAYMKGSYYLGGGKTGMARRLSFNEPSLTLTTSPAQGQTERCHPSETRPLTIREYARIQSFPDDWNFVGSRANQYKQIGNAVAVEFAYHIGLAIKKALKGE